MILYIGDFNSRTGALQEDWDFVTDPTNTPKTEFIENTSNIDIPDRYLG